MYEQSSNDIATGYIMGRDANNCGYGNGMFGQDGLWWLIVLLLFGWGNNGYGFGGGFGGAVGAFDKKKKVGEPQEKKERVVNRDLLEEASNIGDLKRYNMMLQNISISPNVKNYFNKNR